MPDWNVLYVNLTRVLRELRNEYCINGPYRLSVSRCYGYRQMCGGWFIAESYTHVHKVVII